MEMLVFFIDKQLKGQYTLSLYSNTSLARGQRGYSKDIIPCQYTSNIPLARTKLNTKGTKQETSH